MRGDAVLFSLGFESDLPAEGGEGPGNGAAANGTTEKREQLESLGLSIDWARLSEGVETASERWSQRIFLALIDAGIAYRGEGAMRWCESCRTLLPEGDGVEGPCRLCEGPIKQMPAGQWYLRVAANAKAEGRSVDDFSQTAPQMASLPRDLLGPVEGVELEAKALDGAPLLIFTPFPEKIGEARFVLASPSHPALENLIHDSELKARVSALRTRGGEPRDRKLDFDFPSIMDTGAWIHVPDLDDPLPLVISLSVDARFGVTAVLGIPSADPHDEQLSKHLPPPPSMRWDLRVKSSKPWPALRFRAHSLSISSPDRGSAGTPVPLVRCSECGVVAVAVDALPLARDSEHACPKCGKPAEREKAVLDPRVAAWAEMLVAIPPPDRAGAGLDHPELRRWMQGRQSFHGSDSRSAPLCSLVALEALRDLNLTDLVSNGDSRSLVLGKLEVGATSPDVSGADGLAGQAGTDALRFALLHAAAPAKRFDAGEFDAVVHSSGEFLKRLWSFAEPRLDRDKPEEAAIDTSERLRRRLAKWCDIALRKIVENYTELDGHRAVRNVEALLARIADFERRAREERGEVTAEDAAAVRFALSRLILLLAPVAPHICEELWERAGHSDRVVRAQWPEPALAEGSGAVKPDRPEAG